MIPYAVKIGDVTSKDLALLEKATTWMQCLEDLSDMSCHSVCDAWVWSGFPGVHRRGKWARVATHSWIELRPGLVLDLYPVAGVRPSLHARLPFGDPYVPDDTLKNLVEG